jgi:hypothetical protein
MAQGLRISCTDFAIKDLYAQETLTTPETGLHSLTRSTYVGFQSSTLNWQVKEGGIIDLCYPLELDTDPETRILREYLYDHIRSSEFSWILNDLGRGMRQWKNLGGQELKERMAFFNNLESKVKIITGYSFM